jgi:glycosyltransferase involved in cell wall biosynthesis
MVVGCFATTGIDHLIAKKGARDTEMRIAFVAEDARIDGTVRFILRQAIWLKERGYGVGFISAGGPMVAQFAARDIPHLEVRSLSRNAGSSESACADDRSAFLDFIGAGNYCSIIAAAKKPFPFAQRLVGDRIPVFYDILSNDYFAERSRDGIHLVRQAAHDRRIIAHAHGDAVVQADAFGIDLGHISIEPLPITLLPQVNRTDIAKYRNTFGIDSNAFLVLTACRLDEDHFRYVQPLAASVDILRQEGWNIQLLVVGDGTHSSLLRRDAPSGTIYVGTRLDLDRLYSISDLYIGEGSSRLEAAHTGRPVVLSAAQICPQQAHLAFAIQGVHTRGPAYWESNNIVPAVPFAEAIQIFMGSPDTASLVGASGKREVISNHSLDKYMPWLVSLLGGSRNAATQVLAVETRGVIEIDGRSDEELRVAATLIDESNNNLAVRSAHEVSWTRFVRLGPVAWATLPPASRLVVSETTPRFRLADALAHFGTC